MLISRPFCSQVSEILLTNLKLCDNFRHDKQLRNILINLNHQLQDYDEQAALNLQQLYEVFVKQGTIEEVVVKDRTIEEVVVKDRTIEEEGVKQETEEERYVKDEL
ncbi:hypothetical protein M8J76_010730 [Diaphorina citri]|nr:hypothetical protein M8J76_010730 [Diaphorina citri]KAI5714741.1 hypothetical protein M8J77_004732 [Diaphorina citri]